MVLNSLTYIVFLAIVAVVYYTIPKRFQNVFLLVASFVFYLYGAPQYAIVLAMTIGISYFGAIRLQNMKSDKHKNIITAMIVSYIVLVLLSFKYINSISEAILLSLTGSSENSLLVVLPLGISFYSFQLIGYIIDVRNGKVIAEKNFITFTLFASFFPGIISGPIGRASELLPQYKKNRTFCYGSAVSALERIIVGAFKKIVIANGIGIIVDGYFNRFSSGDNSSLLIAMVLYFFQILADFSGYSDMAIGSAKLLGITFRENFAVPYLSKNYSTFWSRWHMSLSSFLQDYIFIPLVWSRWFNRVFYKKTSDTRPPHFLANIMIVFLISGIWHGATLNFLVWGALQGLFRIGEELLHRWRKKEKKLQNKTLSGLRTVAKISFVNLLWMLSLVFFRANDINSALMLFKNLFNFETVSATITNFLVFSQNGVGNSGTYYLLFFGTLVLSFILWVYFELKTHHLFKQNRPLNPVCDIKQPLRLLTYWFMTIAIAMFHLISISGNTAMSFIYMGY